MPAQSRQGRQNFRDETNTPLVARRFLSPLTGLWPLNIAFPTVETVGYFRQSLAGQRGLRCPLICRATAESPVFSSLDAQALKGRNREPPEIVLPFQGLSRGLGLLPRAAFHDIRRVTLPWADLWLPLRGEESVR